jgi:hypothetical protein
MTTLAADKARDLILGTLSEYPVIAADIIYEGAAIGIVAASGHSRPLVGGDMFGGFAQRKADNSAGAAAAINCKAISKGTIKLAVSGAVITDVGQPVYATDDDTFVFLPTGGTFIGNVIRFVSSGYVEVEYDAFGLKDPYAGRVYETLSAATKTLDLEDTGKTFFVTVTSVITLAATAVFQDVMLVNMGPFGTVQISADPVAADKFVGPDLTGVDNKDYINTLATARRGDFIAFKNGHTDGPIIYAKKGTWAAEP